MHKSQSSDAIRAVVVDSECRMECSEHKSGAVDGVFRWRDKVRSGWYELGHLEPLSRFRRTMPRGTGACEGLSRTLRYNEHVYATSSRSKRVYQVT